MRYRSHIFRYAAALLLGWTVIVSISLFFNVRHQGIMMVDTARIQARALFEKDLLYRRWNAEHGGLYAPVTEETPPNPYLKGIVPERDIYTRSGKKLTLINPSYMTRQVHELERLEEGLYGHITSLNPIRPGNVPDTWEREALVAFEKGSEEVSSVEMIKEGKYMRLMRPLITEKPCLKCHEQQGYSEGDIRGGISIAVPMAPLMAVSVREMNTAYAVHFILWLSGSLILGIGALILKNKEAERRQSEETLSLAMETAHIGSWVRDLNTNNIRWSKEAYHIYGIDPDMEPTFENFLDILHPDDLETVKTEIENAVREKKDFEIDYRIVRPDRTERYVHARGKAVYDKDGKPATMIGMVYDVTYRKINEEKLRESARVLLESQKVSRVGSYVLDIPSDRWESSVALDDIFGIDRSFDRTVDWWISLIHPDWQKTMLDYFAFDILEKRGRFDKEYKIIRQSDGDERWVHGLGELKFDKDRKPVKMIGTIQDITERKNTEERLKESEKKFRRLAEMSLVGIYLIQDGIFVYCNNRLAEIFGYAAEELIDRKGPEYLVYPEDWHIVKENLRRRVEGEIDSIHYDFRGITKDRKNIHVDVYGAKTDYQGRPAVLGTLLDITERKKAEKERESLLKELQAKHDELDQLLYITSHDIRSPLVNVEGYAHEIVHSIRDICSAIENEGVPEEVRERIKSILEKDISASENYIKAGIAKMDSLFSGLLEVSRSGRDRLESGEIDMNSLLREITDTFLFQIRNIDIKFEVSDLPPCRGDRLRINQVFSNLITNAIKFLDPVRKGNIKISGKEGKGQSVYCVEDNGIGIASEEKDDIFKIFHRINPDSPTGEGIGLTIVSRIVEKHNGRVWVESEEGRGSRFYVKLPK